MKRMLPIFAALALTFTASAQEGADEPHVAGGFQPDAQTQELIDLLKLTREASVQVVDDIDRILELAEQMAQQQQQQQQSSSSSSNQQQQQSGQQQQSQQQQQDQNQGE